jgi:hypothetical protein
MANFNYASPIVLNSILWGDAPATGGEIANLTSSSATVTYSVVMGGYDGTGNLSSDPLLNSVLTLQAGSPAIDAGGCGSSVKTTDILGNPRWDIASVANATGGNGVDMGAYEYQGAPGTDTIVTSSSCQ